MKSNNEKLTSILEHWLLTNKEIVEEDGTIIEGITVSDVETMIKELKPIEDNNNYKKLLEDTMLLMDVHVHSFLDIEYTDVVLEDYDMTIMFGNTIVRLPLNSDLYESLESMINCQLDFWIKD